MATAWTKWPPLTRTIARMEGDEVTVTDFRRLYERVYGDVIDEDGAREVVRRLLRLYQLLLRRPPT